MHALERTQLVKITDWEFLDDILNTNSTHIIVKLTGTCTYNFLMHQASAFKLNFLSFMISKSATYASHGTPCPARDLFPWLNTRVKVHISVWTIPEYQKRHSSYLLDSGIPSFLNLSCLRTFSVWNIPRYFYSAYHWNVSNRLLSRVIFVKLYTNIY